MPRTEMKIYLQGLLLGLSYCAPIGMQNLFVIDTAITQPRARVIAVCLIVIFFDVTLGLACFLGAGAVMETHLLVRKIILGAGSLLVIWIGVGLLRGRASLAGGKDVNVPLYRAALTACIVTWFNPQAIIDGTLMLGAYRATLPQGTDALFIIGFASASVLWFSTLGSVVSLIGNKLSEKVLTVINKVCGMIIIFYGCKLAFSFCQLIGLF